MPSKNVTNKLHHKSLCLLDYNFILKESNGNASLNNNEHFAFIEATHLADGTYELVLEHKHEPQDAQVNLTEATEALNQSSVEYLTSTAQEGMPRCINPLIFNYMQFMSLSIYLRI